MATASTTDTNRATLLDLAKGGTGTIEVQRYKAKYEPGLDVEADADYNGPILVLPAEAAKFTEALERWHKTQGQEYDGNFIVFKYGHRTHRQAVEDARKEYAEAPALVRHADGLYYMHGEDKPGRPTIVDVLIDEILQ